MSIRSDSGTVLQQNHLSEYYLRLFCNDSSLIHGPWHVSNTIISKVWDTPSIILVERLPLSLSLTNSLNRFYCVDQFFLRVLYLSPYEQVFLLEKGSSVKTVYDTTLQTKRFLFKIQMMVITKGWVISRMSI